MGQQYMGGRSLKVGAYCITVRFLGLTICSKKQSGREELCLELGTVRSLFGGPWVIAGLFNVVRFLLRRRTAPEPLKPWEISQITLNIWN